MTGTQKMIVAIVAILSLAAAAVGIAAVLGDSEHTSLPVSSGTTASPPSQAQPTQSVAPDQPERLRQPWAVRAGVVSGTRVRMEWKAEGEGVRYFQVLDGGMSIGGHVPASKRWAEFDTSYGTHCFRVVAIAESGKRDSSASACGSVTVSKPLPPEPAAPNLSGEAQCEAAGGMWDPTVDGCLGD